MIKIISGAIRNPTAGRSLEEFHRYWGEQHGPLAARAPGLRRYVQNHAIPEADAVRGLTHYGFAELWFDDLEALRRATTSKEWEAVREDGQALFARPTA